MSDIEPYLLGWGVIQKHLSFHGIYVTHVMHRTTVD